MSRQKLVSAIFGIAVLSLMSLMITVQTAKAQLVPPTVRIVLPERFRALTNQYFDLRVEVEGMRSVRTRLQINVINENGTTETLNVAGGAPEITDDNDSNPNTLDRAWTYRKVNFTTPGLKTIQAIVTDGRTIYGVATQTSIQNFNLNRNKNIVLFIGDAMGTAYRDAGRIVAQSTGGRLREGWFDKLQEMDEMPVTGMAMTYSLETLVPDSANTGTAWATGNKAINGSLNVFPDNNDFRYNGANQQATKQFMLDNPRVETLWQYLKRRHNYKTGIVATSDICDATPAAQGGHTYIRGLLKDIAKQYVDGTINNGNQFDVILGGGLEHFNARTAANSGDTRNLVTELQAAGYANVTNRTELNAVSDTAPPSKLLGLFRTGNMNVAYDKLNLVRPADEPAPNFGGFTNQPYLDEMTGKAISVLKKDNAPFILMVEAASIDKQSHPNYAAGQIWDTIELDKSIGVARTFLNANAQNRANNLVLVTADHDQSMSIVGVMDANTLTNVTNVFSTLIYPNGNRGGNQGSLGVENAVGEVSEFPNYADANGDRYPENLNRYRIKTGYRTGNHTGSSVPVTAEGAGALLFYGYYDQTDLFFKMAKSLTIETRPLDDAVELKRNNDVPYFTPDTQLRANQSTGETREGEVNMLPNAPLNGVNIFQGDACATGNDALTIDEAKNNRNDPTKQAIFGKFMAK